MSSLKKKLPTVKPEDSQQTERASELPTNIDEFWGKAIPESVDLFDSPQFQEFLTREFPEQEAQLNDPLSRRRFVQLMGASLAFAGVSGACRWEEEHIVPMSRRPEGYVPGVPKVYSTAWEFGGYAEAFQVSAFDGRPIKIEGNEKHPYTGKASTAFAQANILELYDPDRARTCSHMIDGKNQSVTWARAAEELRRIRKEAMGKGGAGFRVLAQPSSSPTVEAMRRQLLAEMPQAKWHEYSSVSYDNAREGAKMALGAPHRVKLDLARARVIAAFDAELFLNHPAALAHARDFAAGRDPESTRGRASMNRLYAIESAFSLTGVMAEHRLPVRSELIKPLLLGLEKMLSNSDPKSVGAKILEEPAVLKFIAALSADLSQHRGASAIVVGDRQPPEVHAIAVRINQQLGNTDRAVAYIADSNGDRPTNLEDVRDLVVAMQKGQVSDLVILGGNPVYDAPADFKFADALANVATSVHLASYHNETSALSKFHINQAHYLESWGDSRSWDGTLTYTQPIIEPLFGGKSAIEVLAVLAGSEQKSEDLVRQTFQALTNNIFEGSGKAWRQALEQGFASGTALPSAKVALRTFQIAPLTDSQKQPSRRSGDLEVVFVPSSHTFDGRFANNGWLVETPDFLTKLTWDNAALISPSTAENLGISHGQVLKVTVAGATVEIPAYVMPGQAPYSIALPLGWGRKRAGHVGGHSEWKADSIGFDVSPLRASSGFEFRQGAAVVATASSHPLAVTQDHFQMDKGGADALQHRSDVLIQQNTLVGYAKDPNFVESMAHLEAEKPLVDPIAARSAKLSLFDEATTTKKEQDVLDVALFRTEPVSPDHRWGMTTDLSKCIGCNACMLACQAENNVPIVGKEQVMKNREMHWIRIDRYFQGNVENPKVAHQPIFCQQCENAPCEQVCPVGATIHSNEGLNDMAYNRCVGTRYCANNCPYKVRRFNYFYWHKELDEARAKVRKLLFNPEVTVRSRGVMEKCTWCVQRIERAKIYANNEQRPMVDGEVQTACQQACPTQAITFGDLNDAKSNVVRNQELPRAYALLATLNVKPRHAFLARIENPNPALATAPKQEKH